MDKSIKHQPDSQVSSPQSWVMDDQCASSALKNPLARLQEAEGIPCLSLSMRMANRVMSRFYDQRLSEFPIKTTQFSLMRAVYMRPGISHRQLQKILVLDQTTLSRNAKPLLRQGYLRELRGTTDKRQKAFCLSHEGEQLFKRIYPIWNQAQADMIDLLGKDLSLSLLKHIGQVVGIAEDASANSQMKSANSQTKSANRQTKSTSRQTKRANRQTKSTSRQTKRANRQANSTANPSANPETTQYPQSNLANK